MSNQWVLIPRRRETTLGNCIPSRSPNPIDVVEFDVPYKPFTMDGFPEDPEDDTVVFPGDPRLDIIASIAGRDDSEFIKLCQRYRLIPSWWYTEVSRTYRVFYAGKWYINRYATGEISKYEKSLLRVPHTPNRPGGLYKKYKRGQKYGKLTPKIIRVLARNRTGIAARVLAEKCGTAYDYCASILERLHMCGTVERKVDPTNRFGYVWMLVEE